MNDRPRAQPGRPRASDARTVAEAAIELFLEQGYAHTSVDDVARRAGIGRGTFFNYFGGKPDVLWVEADEALAALDAALADGAPLRAALDRVAAQASGRGVPAVLAQGEAMGAGDAARDAGLQRVARLHGTVARVHPEGAALVTAAVVSAWTRWARAGVGRRPLTAELDAALAELATGVTLD